MKSVKEQPFRVSCGFSPTVLLVSFTIMIILFILRQRPPGEMASRLTTNQEIAGSIPAVVIYIFAHVFWAMHRTNYNRLFSSFDQYNQTARFV